MTGNAPLLAPVDLWCSQNSAEQAIQIGLLVDRRHRLLKVYRRRDHDNINHVFLAKCRFSADYHQ